VEGLLPSHLEVALELILAEDPLEDVEGRPLELIEILNRDVQLGVVATEFEQDRLHFFEVFNIPDDRVQSDHDLADMPNKGLVLLQVVS